MEFFERLKTEFNIQLNEQQMEAVRFIDGAGVLISVPGSGKTTTICVRLANMILNHNIDPENILVLTFSRASARDMKDRFYKLFGSICEKKVQFSTIHSFAFKVLRYYYNTYRLPMPDVIEGDETENGRNGDIPNKSKLLRQIYFDINKEQIADDLFEEMQNTINYVKNMCYTSEKDFSKMKIKIPKFAEVFKEYEAFKVTHGLIDYSDMTTNALKILEKHTDILTVFKKKYKYVMVDEAQDTSVVSNALIRRLVMPENNVFFAGDDDQCLYGMNGCSPQNMFDYKNKYPGIKVLFMEQNYRSTAKILATANTFIKKNRQRFVKDIKTDSEPGNEVELVNVSSERDQYRYVAEQIKKIGEYRETAILYRANISAIPLADMLDRYNIPFYIRDAKPHFFKHWVTQDIVAFMTLALDRRNLSAFLKIYYKMNSFISKAMVEYVEGCIINGDTRDIFTILQDAPNITLRHCERFHQLNKLFDTLGDRGVNFAIEYIKLGFGYEEHLKRSAKTMGYSMEYLNMLLSVHESIAEGTNSMQDYLNRLDELQYIMDRAKDNRSKNAVTLSTLHSSKGLEWAYVFMVDMIEGNFPSYSAIVEEKEKNFAPMEEERRLCYVGITRAKKRAVVISMDSKNQEMIEKSRFVYELANIINPELFTQNSFAQEFGAASYKRKLTIDDIGSGVIVVHKKFGEGVVIESSDDKLTILFEKYGTKHLLASVCISEGLLKLA